MRPESTIRLAYFWTAARAPQRRAAKPRFLSGPRVGTVLRDLCPLYFSVIWKHYTCCFDSRSQPPIVPRFKAISESQNSSFLPAGLRVMILKSGEKAFLHRRKVRMERESSCYERLYPSFAHGTIRWREISTRRLQAAGLLTATQGNQWPGSRRETSPCLV